MMNNGHTSDRSETDNSKTNLIVNYLPQSMDDDHFHSLFLSIGELRSAKIIRRKNTGYSYGFGFADYVRPEDAERAIDTLNGLMLENKRIKVAYARPSDDSIKHANIYVQNLPSNFTENDVRELFAPFGNIIQCRTIGNRGAAFVLFSLNREAQMAIDAMNGTVIHGSSSLPINVKFANDNAQKHRSQNQTATFPRHPLSQHPPPVQHPHRMAYGGSPNYSEMSQTTAGGPMRQSPNRNHRFNPISHLQSYSAQPNAYSHLSQFNQSFQPMMSQPLPLHPTPPPLNNGYDAEKGGFILFAYNIGPETNEYSLGELFSNYGKVVRCNVIRKTESRESRGFGFVTMKNYNEAVNAISALNGYNFTGKPLQVSFKK